MPVSPVWSHVRDVTIVGTLVAGIDLHWQNESLQLHAVNLFFDDSGGALLLERLGFSTTWPEGERALALRLGPMRSSFAQPFAAGAYLSEHPHRYQASSEELNHHFYSTRHNFHSINLLETRHPQ